MHYSRTLELNPAIPVPGLSQEIEFVSVFGNQEVKFQCLRVDTTIERLTEYLQEEHEHPLTLTNA